MVYVYSEYKAGVIEHIAVHCMGLGRVVKLGEPIVKILCSATLHTPLRCCPACRLQCLTLANRVHVYYDAACAPGCSLLVTGCWLCEGKCVPVCVCESVVCGLCVCASVFSSDCCSNPS